MPEMHPKALIVEDEAITRTLLKQLLESLECDVDLARDGKEALARLLAHDYDVVLLDIILPKINGIEVMESLRRERPQVLGCIIVVTGLDIREIRSLFPAVHDTLPKPVLPGRLRQAVRSCLARTRGGDVAGVDERITPS